MNPISDLQNYNRELFFQHFKLLTIYIRKPKFISHNQYLFSLLFYRNPKKTHTDQSMLKLFFVAAKKSSSYKKTLFVILLQLASINIFNPM